MQFWFNSANLSCCTGTSLEMKQVDNDIFFSFILFLLSLHSHECGYLMQLVLSVAEHLIFFLIWVFADDANKNVSGVPRWPGFHLRKSFIWFVFAWNCEESKVNPKGCCHKTGLICVSCYIFLALYWFPMHLTSRQPTFLNRLIANFILCEEVESLVDYFFPPADLINIVQKLRS